MFRNVVAALNEALDITMHLKPLTEHFKVLILIKCHKISILHIIAAEAAKEWELDSLTGSLRNFFLSRGYRVH